MSSGIPQPFYTRNPCFKDTLFRSGRYLQCEREASSGNNIYSICCNGLMLYCEILNYSCVNVSHYARSFSLCASSRSEEHPAV
jgi:hypothetical protein